MKLLKGIGKLTYRVFHPVKTFITSKFSALFENIKEKRRNKGKLFTDEQFNQILLEERNKKEKLNEDLYSDEVVILDDEVKESKEVTEEKNSIIELVHEYLKNSRIEAFGAEKIYECIDKIEELGKTDKIINYINESSNITPNDRYQKLLDKMYDVINDIKEDDIDIYDYLTVYLPDDLSDEQRLNVYRKATKVIENDINAEAKIREYLDSKQFYVPASSIDKYNELMDKLKEISNDEIDYYENDDIEVINTHKIEYSDNDSEVIDFNDVKKSDNKEKNNKLIENVDEAFNLYNNGKISDTEFKKVLENAKKDDEIIRKSITEEKEISNNIELPQDLDVIEIKVPDEKPFEEKTLEDRINELKEEREKIIELKQKMYKYSLYHKQNKDDKYRYRKEIFELNNLINLKEKAYNDSYDKLIEEKNEIIRKTNEEIESIKSNDLIKKLV